MKKIFLYLVVFFLFLLLSYKAFFYFDHESEQKELVKNEDITRLSTTETNKLREGDIILRRGFGFFSDYISTTLNKGTVDVTHAGIIVRRNNMWCVIHSLSSDVSDIDGLQIQPLTDFLYYSAPGKIIVTRAKNSDAAFGKKVAAFAQTYLARQIPFDHKGVIDDDSKFFCTELIWKILEKDLNYYPHLPKGHDAREKFFYSMEPMYNTAYYDIVINQYEGFRQ